MKLLAKVLWLIEISATLMMGSFIGLLIAAAGMHSIILGITCILVLAELVPLFIAYKLINNKIKNIKERRYF